MVRNWKRVHGRRPVASLPEYGYTPTAIEFCGTVVIAFQMLHDAQQTPWYALCA